MRGQQSAEAVQGRLGSGNGIKSPKSGILTRNCTKDSLSATNRITVCEPPLENQPRKPLDRPWQKRYARQPPRWDNMHSSIIHHAILLVLISPLFIVAGTVLTPLRGRASLVVPLMLLLLGAAGLFIGVQQAA